MKRLILYTKPDCHLCDVMKAELTELKKEFDFSLEEVNIETDKNSFEKYKEKIPVLMLQGRMLAKYKLNKTLLLKKLTLS